MEKKLLYRILFTIFISFLLIKLIIFYSSELGLVDEPNERSSHRKEIPLGAGIGFMLSAILGVMWYDISLFIEHWYVFIAIIMVLLIGIIDDIRHALPKTKIYVISLAVLLLWFNGITIESLGTYLGYYVSLGLFSLPFTMFALVAFTNALNLIDGIDGLAGMVSFIIIGLFGYIGYLHEDILMMTLSTFVLASLIPFIILNFHPAKVFMGDSGSLSLGFIIAILAIVSLKYIHPVTVLFLTILPLYDTMIVITRRIKNRVPIFKPDQTHMHHILLKYFADRDKKGKTVKGSRRTVLSLTFFQFISGIFGFWINSFIIKYPILPIVAIAVFIVGYLLVYKLFTKIENL